jgi:hypothetical protein
MSHKETIDALRDGLEVLGQLQKDWVKLTEFYKRMSDFISKATDEITGFVEVVRVMSKDVSSLDNDELFGNLLESVEKANQAAFLIEEVSSMYVGVSEQFILDGVAKLDTMMSIDVKRVGLSKVQEEQRLLKENAQTAISGIIQYIKDGEISTRKELVERRNEIMNEYQWMVDCVTPEDREFSLMNEREPVSQ